jgi:hypothetical protein
MLDNASSNDTAVDAILRKLHPSMSKANRDARRLRCFGHCVNLAAQTFLLGKSAEKTLNELALQQTEEDYGEMSRTWRKFGVLGRLHNILKYIRMAPQRLQEFRRCLNDEISLKRFNMVEVS